MDGKGCTDRPAVMTAATALDKTKMAHEVCRVLLGSRFLPVHVDDSVDLMCSAAVCTGDSAYLSTVQLKRIFAIKRYETIRADALGFRSDFQVPTPITRRCSSDSACC